MTKAMQERGIPASKILGQGEITMDDNALRSMGDCAIGIRTVFHYGWEHKSPMNEAFVKAYPGRIQPKSRRVLDRRLGRHAPDLRDFEENRRQSRRRFVDRRGQGDEVGKPAWPHFD